MLRRLLMILSIVPFLLAGSVGWAMTVDSLSNTEQSCHDRAAPAPALDGIQDCCASACHCLAAPFVLAVFPAHMRAEIRDQYAAAFVLPLKGPDFSVNEPPPELA